MAGFICIAIINSLPWRKILGSCRSGPGLMHKFYRVLRVVLCSLLFSYIKRSKAGDRVQSQLTNPSRIKEARTYSPWKRQIFLGQVGLLSLPLVMGIAMRFLWEIFLNVFGSGQSDVRSGNSMTACCVMKGKGAGTRLLSLFIIPPFLALNIVGETSG